MSTNDNNVSSKKNDTNINNRICNNNSDSDDSSVEIVWEDESSNLVDLRHLLHNNNDNNTVDFSKSGRIESDRTTTAGGGGMQKQSRINNKQKMPIAMTQQIDELSFGTMDSDDDNDIDGVGGDLKMKAASCTTNTSTKTIDNKHTGVSSMVVNNRHGSSNIGLTPPPLNNGNLSTNKDGVAGNPLLNSGEVPATISKIRRRRKQRSVAGTANNGTGCDNTDVMSSTVVKEQHQKHPWQNKKPSTSSLSLQTIQEATNNNGQQQKHNEHKKQKMSDNQQDDYFEYGAGSFQQQHFNNNQTLEEELSLSKSQPMESVKQHTNQLPPLQPNNNNRRGGRYDDHLQKENTKNRGTSNEDDDEQQKKSEGCDDLFKEIELGLDKVCAASATAASLSGNNIENNKGVSKTEMTETDQATSNMNANATMNGSKIGSSAKVVVNHVLENAVNSVVVTTTAGHNNLAKGSSNKNFPSSNVANISGGIKANTIQYEQQPQTMPTQNTNVSGQSYNMTEQSGNNEDVDDEFGNDDDFNDDDLAAIDMSVAMTQSHHARSSLGLSDSSTNQQQQLQRAASLPPAHMTSSTLQRSASLSTGAVAHGANNNTASSPYDEFDNDDDDWNDEDLAAIDMAMTQSHHNVVKPASNNNNASTNNTKQQSEFSDFDDDDCFAEVDFNALDDKIVQHRQAMTTHQASGPLPPPPITTPIYNRRHATSSESSTSPSFLSFTRYVIQCVDDDISTYTKTLGVSLWLSPDESSKRDDEMERLRRICLSHESNTTSSVNSSALIIGYMHLRGEWFHMQCQVGDVIHLCSLSGNYITDASALPILLHSHPPANSDLDDDLVLVLHPDELISPTLVSEAVKCPRLAVLQSRLGSTGLSSKPAVIGTLRHELFERCLRSQDASNKSGALFTRQIIRNNAEALMGCGITNQREAFTEVYKTMCQIQLFLQTYTPWNSENKGGSFTPTAILNGMFASCDTLVEIKKVYSTEEWAYVPELGLKGNVDATVLARTKSLNDESTMQDALLPVELKTGHVQKPSHNHLAQLSTYTFMLRARHGTAASRIDNTITDDDMEKFGAANSGMLLYLNHESQNAKHVKPSLSDIKTLIGQRNEVVCASIRATRPRGIAIEYEQNDPNKKYARVVVKNPPPPSALPQLQSNVSTCERCYKNRECMMYASSDKHKITTSTSSVTATPAKNKHGKLLDHFTGHLQGAELDYFRRWDRLIDLEKHASAKDVISRAWLFESGEKEMRDGKCISSLVLDEAYSISVDTKETTSSTNSEHEQDVSIRFVRSNDSKQTTSLVSLSIEVGSYVIVSEDGTSFVSKSSPQGTHNAQRRVVRQKKMHIMKGTVVRLGSQDIYISVPKKDVGRLTTSPSNIPTKFRLDKDEYTGSVGLLLQNLVNFFTLDIPSFSAESLGTSSKTKTLTANTEYSARRRRLTNSIIRLDPQPRFLDDISESSLFTSDVFALDGIAGCDMSSLKRDFYKLNKDQKGAVLKAISAEDFTLIQGLPGTGKSATIAFLTRLLVSRGKRVLISSYTHSAVDNLLIKLMDSGVTSQSGSQSPMIRIGRESSCHLKTQALLAHNVACDAERRDSNNASSIEQPSVEYLHKVVSAAKVVGVSALTAPKSPLLAGQHFDVVIVDEAGQISQPAVLGLIMAADTFVLVGDHLQLPPLVVSEVAESAGYGISMLMHLAEGFPNALSKLTMQYRMNEDIQTLSNIVAYKGDLKCGNDQIRNQKLILSDISSGLQATNLVDRHWITQSINPDQPVIFLDTDSSGWLELDGKRKGAGGPINHAEASIVQKLVLAFSSCGIENSDIGVITPFRSQLRMLDDSPGLQESKRNGLEMCTIDRFQGRDKSVIILSLVRSNNEGKAGRLLQDFRRLNVAFSRAKKKMIIVGSLSTLQKGSDVMRPVLESLLQHNRVCKLPALFDNKYK